MWKQGIIPLMNLVFPGYPQVATREFRLMKIVIAALALAVAFAASPALAQQVAPADTKVISDCLKKADDSGALGTNCIGIVADPCIKTASGKNNDVENSRKCAARELAVWTALTIAAAKKVKAGGFKDISAAVAESEKGWTQLRDKLCSVFDKIEPGFLPGDAAYCRIQITAHRALLLRKLGDAVNEH
jgi:hypothetical protein